TMAKEKGLEPLATYLLSLPKSGAPEAEAMGYVNPEKGVETAEQALQGAMDIIAEQYSDDPDIRQWVRERTMQKGLLVSEQKAEEADEKNVY
ncbi:Tex-like N-terminal domain-containing protein, partial [Bacillus sp. SIMBA_074]